MERDATTGGGPSYRDCLYPLNVFMHVLTLEEGRVDALHYGLFDSPDEPIAVAQERSTAAILARLPAPPARVLEVGIGLGGLLERLTAMGYDAHGIGNDVHQMAIVSARLGDRVSKETVAFEHFTPDATKAFDVVVFQESSQYIDSTALFTAAARLTTRVLVIDEFALQPERADGTLHAYTPFLDAATAAGFQLTEEVDFSSRAVHTVSYFLTRFPKLRSALAADVGVSDPQIDELIASGERYRDRYLQGIYGYRLLDFTARPGVARVAGPALVVDPFLHATPGRIASPLTGRALTDHDADYEAVVSGTPTTLPQATRDRLAADGWFIDANLDAARRFRLRVVSLETHSVCNQACYFCPVSIAPREAAQMPDALFADIARQLSAFRSTIEGVFLNNYNEPTVDPRFIDHCRALMHLGLPVALNTNGTGLTPSRLDRLAELGPLRYLSVNLSTLDRDRYARDRGHDHLDLVLRNLDAARDRPVATQMIIAVLGTGTAEHDHDVETIRARFAGSRFEVQRHNIMDRAGYLPMGLKPEPGRHRLGGCENLGSRPLEHLHITAEGVCVFCCEDYDLNYVVGDLRVSSVTEVLESDEMARLRRLTYGLDDAPEDFICRHCIFAIAR